MSFPRTFAMSATECSSSVAPRVYVAGARGVWMARVRLACVAGREAGDGIEERVGRQLSASIERLMSRAGQALSAALRRSSPDRCEGAIRAGHRSTSSAAYANGFAGK